MRVWSRLRAATLVLAVAATGSGALVTTQSGAAVPAIAGPSYYLSLGDSLAQGYQPGFSDGSETLHGYSNRVVTDVAKRYRLTLENFGCGGATSGSILYQNGCRPGGLANNGVSYPTMPQASAAIAFIKAHHGHIGLITMSIGWNDFDSCVGMANPTSCVGATLPLMKSNLIYLAAKLRAAAGKTAPIVAMTYSNPDLADWLQGPAGRGTAKAWIAELRNYVNPTFAKAWAPSHVRIVDITTAFGTYVPLSTVVELAPYGKIPFAVAQICKFTWMCKIDNEEATFQGYAMIASQIAKYYLHRPT